MHFRALHADDLPVVATIENAVHTNPWTSSQILAVADLLDEHYVAWVLHNDAGVICAYLIMQKLVDEVEVLTIGVAKNQQGQGFGHELLSRGLAELKASDPDLSACFLEVRVSNAPARALYAHADFIEVGRRKNYYLDVASGQREDALILRHDFK